ncbi:MAG: sialate O-acetylesterase [Bacteroidota bacterium]|nr:sialate O-acetylesterase [Bacteroidota bacterium]
MKKSSIILLLLALALTGCHEGPSAIKLPSLIGDNMVLQQKSTIKIWGKAAADKKISVTTSWKAGGQTVSGKDGKWVVPVQTPEAGGPYTVTISTKDTSINIGNVLIGEVWFCSGQSNMEMPVAGWPPSDTIMYSARTIANASLPEIRLFNLQRKVAAEPTDECTGKWEVCSPATVAQFSATAFFFGRKLNSDLKIPVGLIESAWGGTPAESWMSARALENAGEFVSDIKGIRESVPILAEYQAWLDGHKQVVLTGRDDQWKNLDFNDGNVPDPGFDDSKWSVMSLPGLFEASIGDFDGAIWFRRQVEIPESMAGKDLVLSLGPIDDMDRTYFNGKLVGSNEMTGVWQLERNYEISRDIVKPGSNVIAVRVIDNQGGGGIYGKPGSIYLSVKGSPALKAGLDGEWKYQPVAELIGNKFYGFDLAANEFSGRKRPKTIGPNTATTLYNAMVYPAVNYTVKGAIWYQGEANVGRADQYSKIFPLMISNWRDSWQIKDFPFYFVQIAPYEYSGVDSTESAFLREAQEKALDLPNTGMAVTLDIATVMNIHPPFKKEVGERLANLALSKNYGKDVKTQGPVFKSIAIEGKIARISFDNIEGRLVAKSGKLSEFEVAGPDGKYVKAEAKLVNNEVWVTSAKIQKPVSVRYCWRNGSTASLFNSIGLPALQFRTK